MHQGLPGLPCEGGAESLAGDTALDVRGQQVVVVLGEQIEEGRLEAGIVEQGEVGVARARPGHLAHRDDRRSQPRGDALQHSLVLRPTTVDLVHEDERGNPQPLERPHQHPGLRLDTLHSRDDEHGPVEHAEHALHLGDEVRVAGGVDQIDGDVVDREGDDG